MRSSAQGTQVRDLGTGHLIITLLILGGFLGSIYRATHIHTKQVQVVALRLYPGSDAFATYKAVGGS